MIKDAESLAVKQRQDLASKYPKEVQDRITITVALMIASLMRLGNKEYCRAAIFQVQEAFEMAEKFQEEENKKQQATKN